MKTNDEININALTSEVEHYGIKKIKEVEKKYRQKGVISPKEECDETVQTLGDNQESKTKQKFSKNNKNYSTQNHKTGYFLSYRKLN